MLLKPRAHGYARVSHQKQLTKVVLGESESDALAGQEKRIMQFYELYVKEQGVDFGGMFFERAVSAHQINFDRRPQGENLLRMVKPQDHIIIDRIDRIWRNMEDYTRNMKWFNEREIVLHYINCRASTNDPNGRWIIQGMVNNAELESGTISMRIKNGFDTMRAMGVPCIPSRPGRGAKVIVQGSKKIVVWDEEYRAFMGEIVRLHDVEKLGWSEILARVRQMFKNVDGYKKVEGYGWTTSNLRHAYDREIVIRKYGVQSPSEVKAVLDQQKQERRRQKLYAQWEVDNPTV